MTGSRDETDNGQQQCPCRHTWDINTLPHSMLGMTQTANQDSPGHVVFGVFLAALLIAGMWLFTRQNDFPVRYHNDEPAKVKQLVSGEYNFFHPQLMLTLTHAAVALTVGYENHEAIAVVGRTVAAGMGAAAIVCLALAARLMFGTLAGVLVGLMSLSCPWLFVHAHYMKEDTSLLFGLAAVTLAICWYWPRPTTPRLILVGLAMGLLVAGKYIGFYMLPVVAAMVYCQREHTDRRARYRAVGVMSAVTLAVFLVVNYPMFRQPGRFIRGSGIEVVHSVTDHGGLRAVRPSLYYWWVLLDAVTPAALILAAAAVVWMVYTRRRHTAPHWLMLLVPGIYLVLLHVAAIQSARYLLPVILWCYALAGVAVAMLVRSLPGRPVLRAALLCTLAGLVLAPGFLRIRNFTEQFADDSRTRAAVWLNENLTANDRVLQNTNVGLPKNGSVYGLASVRTPLENRTIEQLRDEGVTYLIVSDRCYDRYFSPYYRPVRGEEADYERMRQRYSELFEQYELAWKSDPTIPMRASTNPSLRIYRLNPRTDADDHGDHQQRGGEIGDRPAIDPLGGS